MRPHRAYVRGTGRNRIDPHRVELSGSGRVPMVGILLPGMCPLISCVSAMSSGRRCQLENTRLMACAREDKRRQEKTREDKRRRAVMAFGWVFFLISPARLHVRCTPMDGACRRAGNIEVTPIGENLNASRRAPSGCAGWLRRGLKKSRLLRSSGRLLRRFPSLHRTHAPWGMARVRTCDRANEIKNRLSHWWNRSAV